MREKIIMFCFKLSLAFSVIARMIAYPEYEDKEYHISCLGYEGDFC